MCFMVPAIKHSLENLEKQTTKKKQADSAVPEETASGNAAEEVTLDCNVAECLMLKILE